MSDGLSAMNSRFTLRRLFVVVSLFAVVCAVVAALIPAVNAAREAARRMSEANHFKSIGLALANYHDVYSAFPPAVYKDTTGRPFKSWRIAIVPFVESTNFLTQYNHNQSWDSPFNDSLCRGSGLSHWYRRVGNRVSDVTNIVMPVGPGTIGEVGSSYDDVTDPHGQTILVLGHHPSDIAWHEPRDLSLSEITRAPGNSQHIMIQGRRFQGAFCGFVDGSVKWLPADLDYDTFLAMLTIAGGEEVDMSWDQKEP